MKKKKKKKRRDKFKRYRISARAFYIEEYIYKPISNFKSISFHSHPSLSQRQSHSLRRPFPTLSLSETVALSTTMSRALSLSEPTVSHSLPKDIIFDVLSRLPVKSVTRFKCVTKEWRSLISETIFINCHRKCAGVKRSIFVVDSSLYSSDDENLFGSKNKLLECSTLKQNLPQNPRSIEPVKLIGSCDGLICLLCHPPQNFFLLNPATDEYALIPNAPARNPLVAYGFGYAESIDDYKLVVMIEHGPVVAVFSVRTGYWKMVEGFPFRYTEPAVYEGRFGTHLKGVLHWVFKLHGRCDACLAAFDLVTDNFIWEMPLPEPNYFSTGLLDGCVCLVGRRGGNRNSQISWLLKGNGVEKCWTKYSETNPCYVVQLLFWKKNSKIFVKKDCMMELFSFGTYRFVAKDSIPYWSSADTYEESLVSPKANCDNEEAIKMRYSRFHVHMCPHHDIV